MNVINDPDWKRTQMRRQEQSLPVMKERMPAGFSDEEEEVAHPAPSSGHPRGRRRRAPKKKSRVDEVGGEWKKEDNKPIDIP